MRGSEFVFCYVQLLYYKYCRIKFDCGGWYTDSPDWITNKKVAITLINKKDNKFLQHAVPLVKL